jgi:hypothetical protein
MHHPRPADPNCPRGRRSSPDISDSPSPGAPRGGRHRPIPPAASPRAPLRSRRQQRRPIIVGLRTATSAFQALETVPWRDNPCVAPTSTTVRPAPTTAAPGHLNRFHPSHTGHRRSLAARWGVTQLHWLTSTAARDPPAERLAWTWAGRHSRGPWRLHPTCTRTSAHALAMGAERPTRGARRPRRLGGPTPAFTRRHISARSSGAVWRRRSAIGI